MYVLLRGRGVGLRLSSPQALNRHSILLCTILDMVQRSAGSWMDRAAEFVRRAVIGGRGIGRIGGRNRGRGRRGRGRRRR